MSVKASICPQPDEDQYVQDEYFEFAKLLDEEGFQLEEIGIGFNNTKPLKITNSTAKTEFYDTKLSKKIKYIQLFDNIVYINASLKNSSELLTDYENSSTDEVRKEELKAKCQKKGLVFEEEEAKYQAKLAKKQKKTAKM